MLQVDAAVSCFHTPFFLLATACDLIVIKPLSSFTESSVCPLNTSAGSQRGGKMYL